MLAKPFNRIDRELNEGPSPYLYGYPEVYGDGPETSPYYWWFQYLKRHDGYRRCCERDGNGQYAKLYKDWGDVRTDDFEEWFFEYGELFREPHVQDALAEIKHPSEFKNVDWNSVMVVVCPIRIGTKMLSKKEIKQQFSDLVDEKFPDRSRGRPVYESAAKYRVAGYPNLQALQEMLDVYDLRIAEPNLTLWQIGERLHKEKKLKSAAHHVTKKTDTKADTQDKRRVMTSVVSRHFRIANAYIASAVGLVFPVK